MYNVISSLLDTHIRSNLSDIVLSFDYYIFSDGNHNDLWMYTILHTLKNLLSKNKETEVLSFFRKDYLL